MFPLLLFSIQETFTNNLIPILSVLVVWQRNDNSLLCEVDILILLCILFSTIINRILDCIADENEDDIDYNAQI